MRRRFHLLLAALLTVLLVVPGVAYAQSSPTFCPPGQSPKFVFGFADLKATIGEAMGQPLTCEFPDPNGTGDVHQRTTTGLAFWRKRTNTPTFTDGWRHWARTSAGWVEWTGDSIDPPGVAAPAPAAPTPAPATPVGPSYQGQAPSTCWWSTSDARDYFCVYPSEAVAVWHSSGSVWVLVAYKNRPTDTFQFTDAGLRAYGLVPTTPTPVPAPPVAPSPASGQPWGSVSTLADLERRGSEVTLFDCDGDPVAYIAMNRELTIYLWDGEPVAYLFERSNFLHVYNFDGDHLGWFDRGIMWDDDGYALGFVKGAVNKLTSLEPLKGLKQLRPIRGIRSVPPVRPVFSGTCSRVPLDRHLAQP